MCVLASSEHVTASGDQGSREMRGRPTGDRAMASGERVPEHSEDT
ncbi:hypothetical protein [Halobacterium bonnevillei]|nr:hypothetical protein [Halobacterium bonnevillei]